MDKKIVLARHGETIFNRDGFIMGRSDSPLTPEGISAAKQVARLIEEQNIRTVFCSPLGRARMSTDIYTARTGLPILVREAMAELSCGEWEGKPRSEVGDGVQLIRKTWMDRPPGGESYSDGETRVAPFIQEITSEDVQYPILVVGHASVNRVFLKLWSSLDPECAMMINCPHDTIYLIEDRRKVVARSVTGLETEGFLFHMDRFPSHEGRGCG
jgi:broad specificity phosphatase PhoE